MLEKLKSLFLDDVFFYGFLVILVAVTSFGLGRISQAESDKLPLARVTIEEPPERTGGATLVPEESTRYVASRSGTRFHLLDCPGARRINEENKVYFSTKEEALANGYLPAANCPGI